MDFWSPLRGVDRHLLVALIAATPLLSAALLWQPNRADAARDERTLSLYEIHLKEITTVTFKRDGKYLPEGLKKLNYAMRDWRTGATTRMDPKLFDLVWSLHKQLGSQKPVHVISGHRSAKTNRRLRRRGGGQARKSQHVRGRAMDVHFPDISVSKVRKAAFVHEVGGVGYYPTSALPFVHVDTARVRAWPRMGRRQLAMLFPHGATKHRPSSGGPITSRDRKKARVRLAMLARKRKTHTLLASASLPVGGNSKTIRTTIFGSPPLPTGTKPSIVVASLAPQPGTIATGLSHHSSQLWINKPGNRARTNQDLRSNKSPSPFVKQLLSHGKTYQKLPNRPQAAPPQARVQLASLSPLITRRTKPRRRSNLWVDGTGQRAKWLAEQNQQIRQPKSTNLSTSTFQKSTTLEHQFDAERVAYAPSFDEEHPDELSYRPFQILPLMSSTPVAQNKALVAMVEPKYELIHEILLSSENIPMRFRPSSREAEMLWNNQFKGQAIVNIRKQALNRLLPTRPQRLAQR